MTRPVAGTLHELIDDYRRSPEFADLAQNSRSAYTLVFEKLRDLWPVAVEDIRRKDVVALRDTYADTPAMANMIMSVLSVLFQRAIMLEQRVDNPVKVVKRLKTGEYARWTDEQIAFALDTLPEHHTRAMTVALYTAQRLGDVLRMTWADYDGDCIRVRQQKTGAELWIPVHRMLRAKIEIWKRDRTATTLITGPRGVPINPRTFSSDFSRECRKHPMLNGVVFHGLRSTAAAKLAEMGCSVHEIASITGHKSLQMITHYTREAEQKSRAVAAIRKLEAY